MYDFIDNLLICFIVAVMFLVGYGIACLLGLLWLKLTQNTRIFRHLTPEERRGGGCICSWRSRS